MRSIFIPPKMTGIRMGVALGCAVAVDGLQFVLGPLGFFFFDEILDLIAAGIITFTIGFHPLLLPTFIVELVPMVDIIPTWTGCTLAVLALRKRAEPREPQTAPIPDPDQMKRAKVVEEPPAS